MTPLLSSKRPGVHFILAMWVALAAAGTSLCQAPGTRIASFPTPEERGPLSAPIPSFLDSAGGSLYTHAPVSSSAFIRPTTVPEERSRQVSAAASVSSGYDSAVDDLPSASGEVLFGEAYVGLRQHQRKFDLLLQQDSQVSKSFGTGLSVAQYQRTTAAFSPSHYERTMWSLLMENGYGSDSARAVGNISPSSFDASPVPESDATAFSFVDGNTLTDHVAVNVQHSLTPLRTLDVQAGSYYHHYFAIDTSDQQYSASVSLDQRWTRAQTFGIQAEGVQEHYSTLDCTTGSVNLKSTTQISETTRLEGRIGPIWGSNHCAGTFEYNVSLTSVMPNGNSFYAGSARAPTNGFVVNAAWEEFQYAGFSVGNARRINVRTDAGYSKYVVANPTPANPNQHGWFVSGEVHHRLSDLADISVDARYFYRTGYTPSLKRGIFLLTYRWSREQRPVRMETFGGQNVH
jgi:hypothetical protein